jgi:hypothetical protein
MNSLNINYQQDVPTPKFDTECAIKLQEFEWSLVRRCHCPNPIQATPAWIMAYNRFSNAERRQLGKV